MADQLTGADLRSLSLPPQRGGYDSDIIDSILDASADALDAGEPTAPLIPTEPIRRSRRTGYDCRQVDALLQRLRLG